MRILILPKAKAWTDLSTNKSGEERRICFEGNERYAVIEAAIYGGKGYTTHANADEAAQEAVRLDGINHSYIILDKDGKRYAKSKNADSSLGLSKISNKTIECRIISEYPYKCTWKKPASNTSLDFTVLGTNIENAFKAAQKEHPSLVNLKATEFDPRTQGERWVVYQCGENNDESFFIRDL